MLQLENQTLEHPCPFNETRGVQRDGLVYKLRWDVMPSLGLCGNPTVLDGIYRPPDNGVGLDLLFPLVCIHILYSQNPRIIQ